METSTDLPPQHHLAAVHEAVAARIPERDCIVSGRRRLTFAEVTDRTRRLADALHARGLEARPSGRQGLGNHESHHDHLAIYAYNSHEYLEAMLGAFKARLAPVNVNYKYVAEELRYVLADSGAVAVVFHSVFAPTLAEVLPDLPDVRVLLQIADDSGNELLAGAEWYEEVLAAASGELPEWAAEWSPDDLYILYTGGTTGMPKGVLWRHPDIHRSSMGGRNPVTRQPWATLDELADAAATTPPHVALAGGPYMHGAGHWTALMASNQGWTVAIQDEVTRLDPADLCRVIDREKVSYLQVIGDAFVRPIVEEMETGSYDLSSLRILLSGGAALTAPLKQRLLARLPQLTILEAVGSSEGGSQGLQRTAAGEAVSTGTFSPVEGSIVLAADHSRILTPGDDEIGWLAKRGHDIPIGYLGDADKTARTFPIIDGQRMSVPGDRARWLADGSIELLGRESATINSGGEKIFVEEVEQAISAHPDVYDVVVAPRPSARWGQEVVAIVQLRDGAEVSEDDLAAEAARHVARYKLPKAWVFVEAIPRSPAGKANYPWAKEVAVSSA